jgi:hypothetical protein
MLAAITGRLRCHRCTARDVRPLLVSGTWARWYYPGGEPPRECGNLPQACLLALLSGRTAQWSRRGLGNGVIPS